MHTDQRRRARQAAGTTLIDALFMMLIISLAIIPTAGVMFFVQNSARSTRQKEVALFLARQEISRLQTTFDAIPPGPYSGPPPQVPPAVYTPPVVDTIPYDVVDQTQPVAGETNMVDVAVTVSYPGSLVPVLYATRIFKDAQEMESP